MPDDFRPILRLGHSPDPDDAFMWWPLFALEGRPPRLETGHFRFVPVTADIETLNQRAEGEGIKASRHQGIGTATDRGDKASRRLRSDCLDAPSDLLEITAISCAQYPFVKDRYVLTACGASMGEAYGPRLVARQAMTVEDLRRDDVVIAVPGVRTSAFAAASLLLGPGSFRYEVVPFEQIIQRVAGGEFAAGLIIHEGQLTYKESGLHLVEDLGAWWWHRHGGGGGCGGGRLPLPLGVNVVRRDLDRLHGPGTLAQIAGLLRRSVQYALAHRREAVEYALGFSRGMAADLADQFIDMYVNQWTLEFGVTGREAVRRFLEETHQAGLTPDAGGIDFIAADSEA